MNKKLIGHATQRFIRTFQEIERILREQCKARWDEPFPVVLEQAAKKSRVVAGLASKLADLHALRQRTLNVWGERSAIPNSAAVAELEQILKNLRRARRRATACKPETDGPHCQGRAPQESAKRGISGTAAAVQVLINRNYKEISIMELTAEAIDAGWSPKGKSRKQTLSSALHSEIRRRGDRARFAKGRRPGTWKLSTAGVYYANEQVCLALHAIELDFGKSMELLMKAHDYSTADEDEALARGDLVISNDGRLLPKGDPDLVLAGRE